MSNDISIIIVNYNSHRDIESCIESVISCISEINYEIIIVDNNSPDRGIESVISKFDIAKLYKLDSNLGFGTACNYGSEKANGKYLVFLNPDTKFSDNCLKKMYNFMESTKDAITCSPSFVYPDGSLGYVFNYFPDIIWEFFDFIGKGYSLRINKVNSIIKSAIEFKKPLKVDWITAACLMIRKNVFQEVNGFDKDYFLYYEDVDLQKRITNAEGTIYCLPYLKVVHVANTSTKAGTDDSVYYLNMYRSKLIYYKKNSSFIKYNFVRYLHLIGFYLRLFFVKFRSRYSETKELKQVQYKNIIKYYREGID